MCRSCWSPACPEPCNSTDLLCFFYKNSIDAVRNVIRAGSVAEADFMVKSVRQEKLWQVFIMRVFAIWYQSRDRKGGSCGRKMEKKTAF